MPETVAIGVDIGGTKIAIAAVNRDGRVIAEHTQPTLPEQGVMAVLARICAGIRSVMDSAGCDVAGIGVGCPGAVDYINGVSLFAANLGDGWQNINLREELRTRLALPQMPVWAENDVNAGGFGQMLFGAAKGCDNFVYLMVGTGLGGCAVIDGRMLRGTSFSALEVGHITFNPNGRSGDFGLRGTPEMYVSGKGLIAGWNEYRIHYPDSPLSRTTDVDTAMILQAAREDDLLALHILDDAGEALGIALAWAVTILNPSLVLIGGGLGIAAGDLLLDRARAIMKQRILPQTYELLGFGYTENISSAVGAAALVWYELDRSS